METRPYSRREVEAEAKAAGPWTDDDTRTARELRELKRPLTAVEQRALAVLRQREINFAVAYRRTVKTP